MQKNPNLDLKKIQSLGMYFLFGGIILGEVLCVVFGLWPWINKTRALQKNLSDLSAEYKEMSQSVALLTQADKNQVAKNLAVATAALPDEKKTSGIVSGITSLAAKHGLAVKSLEFSPGLLATTSATAQTTTDIPASLVLIGKLKSVITFLDELEKSSQILGVSQVGFSTNVASGESSSLSLTIYFQPLKKSEITWRDIKPISSDEQKLLDSLPPSDIFTLQ